MGGVLEKNARGKLPTDGGWRQVRGLPAGAAAAGEMVIGLEAGAGTSFSTAFSSAAGKEARDRGLGRSVNQPKAGAGEKLQIACLAPSSDP